MVDNFGQNAVSNAGVKYDLHDFGPRVGFAWSPFGASTVIRRGGGYFMHPRAISSMIWEKTRLLGVIPARRIRWPFLPRRI